MSEKPMTDAEFKALEERYAQDLLNYNEDAPLLFEEIGRLRGELERYRELAKVTQEMLNCFSVGSWVISSKLFTRASILLKELKEAK